MSFDVVSFRKFFPQLERKVGPNPLIYLDNGASTLKHSKVTDRVNSYNRFESSNVHRGAHHVSRQGTEEYEGARSKVAQFLNASDPREIVFTRGTTESVNLVASILEQEVNAGDEVVITPFEHHSNIVPWQVLCEKRGAFLKVVPFDKEKGVTLEAFKSSLSEKTKIAAFIHYSNSFGQKLAVENFVEECGKLNIFTLIDGAQALLAEKVDVQKIGCDFYAFSGHKVYGPYGIGVLYGKAELLEKLPPYQTGGSMIDRVTFEKTTYADIPQKYEAGTPNIAGAIGLGEALRAVEDSDVSAGHDYVVQLRQKMKDSLQSLAKTTVYDFESDSYTGVLSFNVDGAHSSDVGTLLDKYGIAVRAGHHCTQPLMELMGVSGTVRASLAPYNTIDDVNALIESMRKVEDFF